MPQIQVSVNQNQVEINPSRLETAARQILNALGYTEVELSVAIVDDEEMSDLNSEYRQVDSTTDVLSFPMWEGEYGDVCQELLGDVVISAPTAQLMSLQRGCPLPAVLDLLLVHGILHLLGFDHETGEEAQEMEAKTMEILHMLGHDGDALQWYMNQETAPEEE